MKNLEMKLWSFIEKNKFIIFMIIVTIISLVLRISLIDYNSGDYDMFLEPWFNELKDNGGLKALNLKIGDYNAPYMTILALLTYLPVSSLVSIKAVSIMFDYICAVVLAMIALYLFKEKKEKKKIAFLLYCAVIFLPTVFLNSACWAQCDSIYIAFVLISLLYLIKKNYKLSFIMLGIAFSFKLQTIFILPLYILSYISERKFSFLNFFWIIISDAVMCIPSIIFGKSFLECINVYIEQTGTYSQYITLNFPNFYGIFWGGSNDHLINVPNELLPKIGIICTFVIFVLISFLVIYKRVKFDSRAIIEFGLWSVLICTFLLPSMHERYLFIGDILALLYLIFNKDKFYITLGIELVSLYGYLYHLFYGYSIDMSFASVFYFTIFIIYSVDMYKKYFLEQESKI